MLASHYLLQLLIAPVYCHISYIFCCKNRVMRLGKNKRKGKSMEKMDKCPEKKLAHALEQPVLKSRKEIHHFLRSTVELGSPSCPVFIYLVFIHLPSIHLYITSRLVLHPHLSWFDCMPRILRIHCLTLQYMHCKYVCAISHLWAPHKPLLVVGRVREIRHTTIIALVRIHKYHILRDLRGSYNKKLWVLFWKSWKTPE